MKILCLIPARRGSRGLKGKNVRRLAGVPLLVRAIQLAQRARRRRDQWQIVCSTDSEVYARLARRAGALVPELRPPHLAGDTARLIEVVLDFLQRHPAPAPDWDAILLLSATTPLTTAADVRGALTLFERTGQPVVSISRAPPGAWQFEERVGYIVQAETRASIGRRQESAERWALNGAIFIARPESLRRHRQFFVAGKSRGYRMPRRRSVDIETLEDFRLVEQLLRGSARPRVARAKQPHRSRGAAGRGSHRRATPR